MKKIILIVVAIFVLLASIIFFPVFMQIAPEIPSRLAKYHNKGQISVSIDGEQISLDGVEILFKQDTGETINSAAIIDNQFRFEEGRYGFNILRFNVPNEYGEEIIVEIGQFNTNWWHVCEYDIDIVIAQNDEEDITAQMNTKITVEGFTDSFEDVKIITAEDNIISNLR